MSMHEEWLTTPYVKLQGQRLRHCIAHASTTLITQWGGWNAHGEMKLQHGDAQVGPRNAVQMQHLYGHLLDFGDMDLLTSGVHEHAWGLRYMDVHMATSALVADRLRDADCLASAGFRRADFGMIRYAPALVLNVRRLVSGTDR